MNSEYTITAETFESVSSYWHDPGLSLRWDCLFVLPPWLKAWWHTFGSELTPCFRAVRFNEEIVGIAPLMLKDGAAHLMGDGDVCDYLDLVTAPGREAAFCRTLVAHLREEGLAHLVLTPLREDSQVMTNLVPVAKEMGCDVSISEENVSMELDLPETWPEFLAILSGKERHEVRRKLRRLHDFGDVRFRVVDDDRSLEGAMETFLELFRMNRPDKATFMGDQMAGYFKKLAEGMAEAGILKLFFLEIDAAPAAAVMCFDHGGTRYLYNNGYDSRYRSLSVGLLGKVLSIEDSILCGHSRYSFLKGAETYKSHLGGKPIAVLGCRIKLV